VNAAAQAAWRARNGGHRFVSVKPGTSGGKILAFLAERGLSQVSDIAAGTGMTSNAASVTLSGLLREDHVRRPAQGVYCLPDQEARELERIYHPGPEGRQAMNGRDWAAGTTWTTRQMLLV
jgi:hypothetical protein